MLGGRAADGEEAHQPSDVGLGREDELHDLDLGDTEREVELLRGVVQPGDLLLQGGQREGMLQVVRVELAPRQHGEADERAHRVRRADGASEPVDVV